ncbi:hypothetical protein QJS10_CPB17g00461 [Acorus calamus]|uniref:GBF-interacting protein 1 N-terminal domain-containing protein n=1 Tax=Acorus calamus TaxID=4465 RepID=A0AAV9CRP4_ACOCL|nr:hypothetical protein QJS10_CPB17g00461 [Acorus calamus]
MGCWGGQRRASGQRATTVDGGAVVGGGGRDRESEKGKERSGRGWRRVSIPGNVRKTIQNIREITGNHSDDEIYAMLRDCSMDPNETAQKLLLQVGGLITGSLSLGNFMFGGIVIPSIDVYMIGSAWSVIDPFHEVKRKRDRKKENPSSKEPVDSRWRSDMQGRGVRVGRGNYSSHYASRGEKSANVGKENGGNQKADKSITLPAVPALAAEDKSAQSSSVTGIPNGPMNVARMGAARGRRYQVSSGSGISTAPDSVKISSTSVAGAEDGHNPQISGQLTASVNPSAVTSASDPIRREMGRKKTGVESATKKTVSREAVESDFASSMHGKIPSKSQGVEVNHLTVASQVSPTPSHAGNSVIRPSSNYNSRSQLIGSQKAVGPSKEWKPKSTNPMSSQASGTTSTSDIALITPEAIPQSLPISSAVISDETALKLQEKLEVLHLSERQHVIIPSHLQVPEAERSGLSFGSFVSSFDVSTSIANGLDSEKCSTPLSESSQEIEETVEESSSSSQNVPATIQSQDYADNQQSPTHMPQSLSSGEANASSSIPTAPEYDQSKPEIDVSSGQQYSVVQTTIHPGIGLVPPTLGSQLSPFDSSEPQARDASSLYIHQYHHCFTSEWGDENVQQPFDPSTSYYTQFYRPGADGDGRFSPFLPTGSATKFNGNIALLPSQTGQSPQEAPSGNSLIQSNAGPTQLVTQTAGSMLSSLSLTQQPVPIFRQPVMSPYPPNYIPYNQYFSPFYVPQPTIHHFLSNTGFPQQAPTGGVFPPPTAAPGTAVKYAVPQYKPGTNTGGSPHVGMPYGSYSSGLAGYNSSPAVSAGNSTGSEDLGASQYKENMYITGQQTEGSAVWIPAPGREMNSLQPNSFYNLPPQGQHIAFAPPQATHGAFAGVYHPTQTVAGATVHPLLQQSQTGAGAIEMVGAAPAGVYQQPQRTQINWTNNY